MCEQLELFYLRANGNIKALKANKQSFSIWQPLTPVLPSLIIPY